jgi:transposase-like protein
VQKGKTTVTLVRDKRAKKITGTGGKNKTAVMGNLERGGRACATVVPNCKKKALQAEIREHVLAGSAIFTDALKSYERLNELLGGRISFSCFKLHLS